MDRLIVFLLWLAPLWSWGSDILIPTSPPPVGQVIVVPGTACPGIGAVGFDSGGVLMSCQSGLWAKAAVDVPDGSVCGLASAAWGATYASCSGASVNGGCPPGYTLTQFADGAGGGIQYVRFCARL